MVRHHRLTVPALIAAFLLGLITIVPATANNTAQTLPFSQNWSNTSQINSPDNWATGGPAPNTPGVQGVIGFLGQDITTAIDADPQTLLGVSASATDVDVIPNQTNTAITNGGVAEFELADPVVALQGSGTADAPHLLFHLDTTGASNITISYNLRDIDPTGDDATQQVALQYRVGATGNFTNVPAGYVADATSGGSATQVTPVSAVLPPDANNQSLVQVRVMTTNATGSDEWVGVDDISVVVGPDPEPTPTPEPTPNRPPRRLRLRLSSRPRLPPRLQLRPPHPRPRPRPARPRRRSRQRPT